MNEETTTSKPSLVDCYTFNERYNSLNSNIRHHYGGGNYFCGDVIANKFDSSCNCGNVSMNFLKQEFTQYCCHQSVPCSRTGNDIQCPGGKVLDMSEQCEDKCYSEYNNTLFSDPLNSNYKCVKYSEGKGPPCLPIQEMCQGLDICGEVNVCKKDLDCADCIGSGVIARTKLQSQLTQDHYFCHYSTHFDNDYGYDYIDRKDETISSRLRVPTIAMDFLQSEFRPCKSIALYTHKVFADTSCSCAVPGLVCPGSSVNSDFPDDCLPIPLWCNEDSEQTCKVGNDSISSSDKNLCKNYNFWRSVFEKLLSFSVASNRIKLTMLFCRGNIQGSLLPWYYNSFGTFDASFNFLKINCEDKSDRIHQLDTYCNSRWGLQIYQNMWCGDGRFSNILTKCDNLKHWFSTQTSKRFTDPHRCQDSCSQPGPGCKACTNPGYFICEQSQVCIHPALVCDGHPQCEFGEDEDQELCSQRWVDAGVVEPYASFTCQSLMYPGMVTVATACNGIVECYDGSDERSCSDNLSTYFFTTAIFGIILLYLILKYFPNKDGTKIIFDRTNLVLMNLDQIGQNSDYFLNHLEEKGTIEKANILLLQVIFSQNRDFIKERCVSFYGLIAKFKKNNESEVFTYLHNNLDTHVMKEISKAKFPGLTEKITDKIEKLVHCRFITMLQDKITKSNMLDEIISTLNTIRTIVSYFFDFFKDSYLALYLLVICGGPKAVLEYFSNFTSVIILSLVATIVIPISISSAYIALKNPSLIFNLGDDTELKMKNRILTIVSGPLIPVFILHSLQTMKRKLKLQVKGGDGNIIELLRDLRKIKALHAVVLRIELGELIKISCH